jgi:hypothetical protein
VPDSRGPNFTVTVEPDHRACHRAHMPLKGIPFLKFISPLTSSPWTRHFRHMEPTPRHWLKKAHPSRRPGSRVVPPKDRIKFWNIVPGDKVRLRGDSHSRIYQVFKVNKLANTVHFTRTSKDEVACRSCVFDFCRLTIYVSLQAT